MTSEDSAIQSGGDTATPSIPLGVPFWQVDAFTDQPWRGNPAGVCLLQGPGPEAWMQAVAAEVNVAETAFVHPLGDRPGAAAGWGLRWFTPAAEVDLCGHATLASAHVLWTSGTASGPLAFQTRSGVLRAEDRGADGIQLDFPVRPAEERPLPATVLAALGTKVLWSGRSDVNWLAELADPRAVVDLTPDLVALQTCGAQGVIVTAAGGADVDFVSRYFAPAVGVPEDPVTGSAHCTLGPFWAERLGRTDLVGSQVSRRGGRVGVRLVGGRALLSGQAVTVLAGTIHGS